MDNTMEHKKDTGLNPSRACMPGPFHRNRVLGDILISLKPGYQGNRIGSSKLPRAPSYLNSGLLGYVSIGYIEPRALNPYIYIYTYT